MLFLKKFIPSENRCCQGIGITVQTCPSAINSNKYENQERKVNLLLIFFMADEKQRGSEAVCVWQALLWVPLLWCWFLIPSPFPFQGTPGKPGPRGQRGPTVTSQFFILVLFKTLLWPKGNWDVLYVLPGGDLAFSSCSYTRGI